MRIENRRQFIKTTSLLSASALVGAGRMKNFLKMKKMIACQQYTWFSYFRREGKEITADLQAFLRAFKSSGLSSFEPSFGNLTEAERLKPSLAQYNITTKSMYVNSVLHEEKQIDSSIKQVVLIAEYAKKMGIEIVVTNPSPIKWGAPIDKSDKQILRQAKALDHLGKELRKMGMKLAYHNHDMEMRQSAREFHHMMCRTDPDNVHLCLDAHWIYRGAGNSQVALFDIVKLYGNRIVELHLRQSRGDIWSEIFGTGDIDYPRLAETLLVANIKPHIVLEQAVENGTPHTLNTVEAIAQGLVYTKEIFNAFLH